MIAAQNITVARGGRKILDDVSLAAGAGTLVAVIGPNGAGKSTLLSVLAGLLKPDSGEVTLEEAPLFGIAPKLLARRRAYLPQNPHLEWPLPVERLVALGLTPHLPALGELPQAWRPAITRALELCDLAGRREQPATTLSGGEFARAMLARAIVGDPEILIVDEPITGLDPRHAMKTMTLLSRFAADGKLVIASLHDLTLAARHASRIVALLDGKIAGDTAALTPRLIRTVFGVKSRVSREGSNVTVDFLAP
jgi:iron complex transport system ATP-binding protein